jgi:dTDP-4-dehydrorhamnose reductase
VRITSLITQITTHAKGAANRFPDSVAADPSAARALNVESTAALATETARRGILLVYISTDYVFAGRPGESPYEITDKPDPPNLYGLTKYEGERAVLAACGPAAVSAAAPLGVVLRVPLLYGHCEEEEKTKSAVHALLDVLKKAQSLPADAPKIKVDSWSLRFPTCTEDVGRVVADISALYLDRRGGAPAGKPLPEVLHFSSEAPPMTKWDMTRFFAEDVMGMSLEKLEPHDPSKDPDDGGVQRPYDTHLSSAALREIGVQVACEDFKGWW